MTTSALPRGWWLTRVSLLGMYLMSWPGLLAILLVLLGILIFRLLAERARRRTLIELIERSPGGTIMIQGDGPGGPAMWVQVGDGQSKAARGGLP